MYRYTFLPFTWLNMYPRKNITCVLNCLTQNETEYADVPSIMYDDVYQYPRRINTVHTSPVMTNCWSFPCLDVKMYHACSHTHVHIWLSLYLLQGTWYWSVFSIHELRCRRTNTENVTLPPLHRSCKDN